MRRPRSGASGRVATAHPPPRCFGTGAGRGRFRGGRRFPGREPELWSEPRARLGGPRFGRQEGWSASRRTRGDAASGFASRRDVTSYTRLRTGMSGSELHPIRIEPDPCHPPGLSTPPQNHETARRSDHSSRAQVPAEPRSRWILWWHQAGRRVSPLPPPSEEPVPGRASDFTPHRSNQQHIDSQIRR